ncbi:MAG: type IX secretion system membrane protein PorP/SprF [Bacteroidota bacterium]
MKIRVLIFSFIVSCSYSSYSQEDLLFINGQQALVHVNPSFAGSNGLFRTQSLINNQTPVDKSQYKIFYNSVDAYIKPLNGGVAFTHEFKDVGSGTLQSSSFALSYAQYFSLGNEMRIIPSIQVAYLEKELDKTKLSFNSIYHYIPDMDYPLQLSEVRPNRRCMDLGTGLLVNYKDFYFGAGAFHINKPNVGLVGDYVLPVRLSVHGSYNHRLNNWVFANIFAQFEKQGYYKSEGIKINFLMHQIILGIGHNTANGSNANLGYRNSFFTIGLSYNQRLSRPFSKIYGWWEAQLSINIRGKEHRRSVTAFERW